MPPIYLSIVIPTYNEESLIISTLGQVAGFLATREHTWEVVVADDGSTDGTAKLVEEFINLNPHVRLLRLSHGGKGWAVRQGILEAKGEYRFLCDADLSMPIEQLERFLPAQVQGLDIAVGSREAPGARRFGEPAIRHLMGRVYNRLVRVLAVRGLSDTQCGFKCFRGEIVPLLFLNQTMDGFSFDVEVLLVARKEGLRIREIPIDWHFRKRSKVRPLQDTLSMTRDLLKIRWRYRKGRYLRAQRARMRHEKLHRNDSNRS